MLPDWLGVAFMVWAIVIWTVLVAILVGMVWNDRDRD